MKEERHKQQEEWKKLRLASSTPQPNRIPLYVELENKYKEIQEREEFEKR
jgi:ribosomal protein L39E